MSIWGDKMWGLPDKISIVYEIFWQTGSKFPLNSGHFFANFSNVGGCKHPSLPESYAKVPKQTPLGKAVHYHIVDFPSLEYRDIINW